MVLLSGCTGPRTETVTTTQQVSATATSTATATVLMPTTVILPTTLTSPPATPGTTPPATAATGKPPLPTTTKAATLPSKTTGTAPTPTTGTPPASRESHFGMVGGTAVFADRLQESGAEITRVWISWKDIEPANDQYDWTALDATIASANARHIEVLGYFVYMPAWAKNKASPKYTLPRKDIPADPCEPVSWNDYTQFAREVAARYDGKHGHGEMRYIEIWNEVQGFAAMNSQDYAPWLIKGYQAVKEGNPAAQVLLGAVHSPLDFDGGDSGETTEAFITAMLRDYSAYYDIFNFHIYQHQDSAVGETTAYMKGFMGAYHVRKPMWITETATFWATVPCDGLAWRAEAARGVIKRYAQALGNGVDKVFWYQFAATPTVEEDPTGMPCKSPANFQISGLGWVYAKGSGLPTDEYHPRPAFNTYQLMAAKLAGFTAVEKLSDTQYRFSVNGKSVYVLWCETGSCPLPAGIAGTVRVTDYAGKEETRQASQVTLGSSPVFVE